MLVARRATRASRNHGRLTGTAPHARGRDVGRATQTVVRVAAAARAHTRVRVSVLMVRVRAGATVLWRRRVATDLAGGAANAEAECPVQCGPGAAVPYPEEYDGRRLHHAWAAGTGATAIIIPYRWRHEPTRTRRLESELQEANSCVKVSVFVFRVQTRFSNSKKYFPKMFGLGVPKYKLKPKDKTSKKKNENKHFGLYQVENHSFGKYFSENVFQEVLESYLSGPHDFVPKFRNSKTKTLENIFCRNWKLD